jgi:hypothetical protein
MSHARGLDPRCPICNFRQPVAKLPSHLEKCSKRHEAIRRDYTNRLRKPRL